jgi:predicted CopG family antitoxin
MLGDPTPHEADPIGAQYAFEKLVSKAAGGDGFADVWKRDLFAWEHGSRTSRRATSRRSPGALTPDGYTSGMKTAVSVPDDVFERAERLARREKRSRSDVYSAALREYVARYSPDDVAEALDRVVTEVGEGIDPFVTAAGRQILESTDW